MANCQLLYDGLIGLIGMSQVQFLQQTAPSCLSLMQIRDAFDLKAVNVFHGIQYATNRTLSTVDNNIIITIITITIAVAYFVSL